MGIHTSESNVLLQFELEENGNAENNAFLAPDYSR